MLTATVLMSALVLAVAASNLPYPQMRVTFDEDKAKPLNVKGRPYDLSYEGEKNPVFETAPMNEGLVLDGNYFLLANESRMAQDKENCLTDFELCEEGYTLSLWVKPQTPWQGKRQPEYIVSLGGGVGNPFGVKIAIRRRTLFFQANGRHTWQEVECKIPADYNSDAWMHLVLKGGHMDQPLVPFWNGDKMKNCKAGDIKEWKTPTENTIRQLVVGAERDPKTGAFLGLYHGDVDDLQFFFRQLQIPEIRDIFAAGKDVVADKQKAKANVA